MKQRLNALHTITLSLLLTLNMFFPIHAENPRFTALQLPVKGWLLMDYDTGMVLAEENGYQALEPASITKVMTNYVIAESIKNKQIALDDLVLISANARKQEGSRMFIEQGKRISVNNLMKGLVIHSGNDATIALAEYISGSEANFVKKMNEMAQKLKLKDTHYANATGLPHPQHLTTAYDIAALARAFIQNHPDIYQLYSEKSFTWGKITQNNRNRLLFTDKSVDGIKTGYTQSAGYSLISSAKRNDFRLIAVVLGAKKEQERYKAAELLLNYGYRTFQPRRLFSAHQMVGEPKLYGGKRSQVKVGLKQDLNLPIDTKHYAQLKASLIIPPLVAPIQKDSTVGHLIFTVGQQKILELPVVALESIEKSGFISQLYERFKYNLTFKIKNLLSSS